MTMREIILAKPLELAPYGLLGLVDPDPLTDNYSQNEARWIGGFYQESLACSAHAQLLDVCGGHNPIVIATPTGNDYQQYTPFAIEAWDQCTTFGFKARHAEERALAALEVVTPKAIEHELWTGQFARANGYSENRFLASNSSTDVTPTGGAVKVKYGVALLEKALGDCGLGARGTIHMPRDVASVYGAKVVENHLETPLGNYVVAGTGYSGEGPDGTKPTTGAWIYATGPVTVLLEAPNVPETEMFQNVDTKINNWRSRAQRGAAVTWDGCCAFAVHVDLTLDYF